MYLKVGVIGSSGKISEDVSKIAYEVGKHIAKNGATLFTGGRDGVMEAASKGAKENNGITVGVLPFLDLTDCNNYVDIPLTTGLGLDMRSDLMVRMCDGIIMIGGANGTLKELTATYYHGKPVVVIEGTGGASDRIKKYLYNEKYLDLRENIEILFEHDPIKAVEIVLKKIKDRKVL